MPRVCAVQFDIAWEDKGANHARVEGMLAGGNADRTSGPAASGSQTSGGIPRGSLVVLPELFDVGFSLNVEAISEQATGGASETWCAEFARRHGVFVQGASVQRREANGKATNGAVVFDPDGRCVCRYEKIHPFSDGREAEAFVGGRAIATYEWNGMRVCPFVCYDLRFPEIWRIAAIDHGAEMFTIGANWPKARHEHWTTLLRARAIECQAWVVGVNRCGRDPSLEYAGGTRVIDPKGRIVAEAGDGSAVVEAEVDAEAVRKWRAEFGALRDARREFLGRVGN